MDQDALEYVLVVSKVRASHAAGFKCVREASLNELAASSHQSSPALPTYSTAIGVHLVSRVEISLPLPPLALRLGYIASANSLASRARRLGPRAKSLNGKRLMLPPPKRSYLRLLPYLSAAATPFSWA
jgi:hypothetical protein